jgi:hypothetical protein
MKEYFWFFVNPGPSIFLTIAIFIMKISGFDIPWIVVFYPLIIWLIALIVFGLVILWGVRKAWKVIKDFILKFQK